MERARYSSRSSKSSQITSNFSGSCVQFVHCKVVLHYLGGHHQHNHAPVHLSQAWSRSPSLKSLMEQKFCSNLWIVAAIFLRSVRSGRILGQQLLSNKKTLDQRQVTWGHLPWHTICYLVDVVLLHTTLRHNNTFCQLLQFQVVKQRELRKIGIFN